MKQLLSGNEAMARGAWEAGVAVASAYPGTPSTEILENFGRYPNVYAEWAPNEKVAVDVAVGAAYAGRRAMAAMKHVGVNVAADSVFYASMTGLEAGLVIVTADDPAMHSSQNEQDNRRYAKFARMPCLEPTDSQEAKDMVGAALDISEQFDTPVFLRLTTRICHSSAPVELGEQNPRRPPEKSSAQSGQVRHGARQCARETPGHRGADPAAGPVCRNLSVQSGGMGRHGQPAQLGIVTCGVAYQYAKEIFPDASILRLGMTYPLPPDLIRDFAAKVDRLIVIEELDPFIEEEIKADGHRVRGQEHLPHVWRVRSLRRARERDRGRVPARVGPRAGDRAGQARDPASPAGSLPGLPPPQLCSTC